MSLFASRTKRPPHSRPSQNLRNASAKDSLASGASVTEMVSARGNAPAASSKPSSVPSNPEGERADTGGEESPVWRQLSLFAHSANDGRS